MVPDIDNKINLIRKTIKLVVNPPPPPIIFKYNTGATVHYLTPEDYHALVNIEPTKMGPRVEMPDNIMMYPQLVGHLHLALPPAATETRFFQPYKIPHCYRLVSCMMMDTNPFSKTVYFKSWRVK